MKFFALFINRPVATTLLTLAIALAGMLGFRLLPVAPLPQVDFPVIVISASLPGAAPEIMASSVATPLERSLGRIAGVSEMTSTSSLGSTRIILVFDFDRDINGAARDVQAAINAAQSLLPTGMPSRPTYRKVNPSDAPIMIMTLTSDTYNPGQLYDYASTQLAQKLSQIEGVGDVTVGGSSLPAVRVALNPQALFNQGVSLDAVRTAISNANQRRPQGALDDSQQRWQLRTNDALQTASEYQPLIVHYNNGAAVRLSDVATVEDSVQDVRNAGMSRGKPAVLLLIRKTPEANVIDTVDRIRAEMPLLHEVIPAAIDLQIAQDRSPTIRASLHEVEQSLVIAVALVILVVFVFLRSGRATLIPAVAVPVSLIGTFAAMYLCGFSLNNLSLMALTVATGFVVDDAIVVLENISRHVEDGMRPLQAALRGAREVGFTVLSISISLVAVFIPLLFMAGIIGRLFREFAVTMTVAVLISLVISLTTTPMIAARLLRERDEARENRFSRFAERTFDRLQARYAKSLDWALANRGATLLLLAGAVALNIFLLIHVQKGFFPEQDTGSLQGGLRADQSISFADMQTKLTQIVKVIRKDPAIENVVAFTGGSRAGGGFMFATLKPKSQRDDARTVINRLRPKLARITGVATFLSPVQDMRVGGRSGNSTYQYTLQADDPNLLAKVGPELVTALKKYPELTDLDIDEAEGAAEVYVDVDRDAATRLGITSQSIDNTLYDAFGQRQVATIYSGLNQYHIVMGVAPDYTGSPAALDGVYVPARPPETGSGSTAGNAAGATTGAAPTGQPSPATPAAPTLTTIGTSAGVSGSTPVSSTGQGGNAATGAAVNTSASQMTPLSSIATWSTQSTAAQINHQDAAPSATISFSTGNGYALGDAIARIQQVMASMHLPTQIHGAAAGTAQVFQQSTQSNPILIIAAIVVIYIVLGILYESAIHPLTVLSTLPSAGVGAVIALMITGSEFDLIGLIGLILLIGIVKKNAILIIDFALDAERSRGLSAMAAIREASLLRFRPILMTTMAAAFGALPLAIGFGEGAELRRPLGIAIIGGLIASQFLTLLTTPVVYLALDRFRRRSPHERLLARHDDVHGIQTA